MSVKHPIISVTGSSGAGTSTVKHTFDQIFRREGYKAVSIEGDAFHRFNRADMKAELARRIAAEESLRQLNTTLEERVAARTRELHDLVVAEYERFRAVHGADLVEGGGGQSWNQLTQAMLDQYKLHRPE